MSGSAHFLLAYRSIHSAEGASLYHQILYQDLYPGIDLTYSPSGATIKSEFVVRPGSNPAVIRFQYPDNSQLSLDPSGTLLVQDGTTLLRVFSTDPVLTACGDGSLYVVGKDNYNVLWSGHYIPGTGFQGFVLGGGVVQGKPSVSCGSDNTAYISARDNYNSSWVARVSGNTWTGWFNGGAVTNIDTRIAALGGSLAIVILDATGAV